ncbi:MAG: radical SAM protein [Thermodesulfobacteriota bacterium]
MKILFVYPEFEKGGFKPIGISLLSALLAREGHDRRLFDSSLYDISLAGKVEDVAVAEKQLLYPPTQLPAAAKKHISKDFVQAFQEEVMAYRPDLVAFSCTSMTYPVTRRLAQSLAALPHRPATAIGGIHTMSYEDEVVAEALFDYICLGEGERAISEILAHLRGERDAHIANVYVREGRDYVKNPLGPMFMNLDELPYLDWSLYEEYHYWRPYQGQAYKMGDIQTSRGCPYRCVYCFNEIFFNFYRDTERKKVRFFSPERIIEEMAEHTRRHSLSFWKMHDSDTLLRPEEKFGELMELYARRVNLPFVCNANANSITREKVKALKQAGCQSVSIGVETGREDLRKLKLQKDVSNAAIIEAVARLKEAGIRVCTSNMLGLPEETPEDIRETIRLNRLAQPDLAEPTYFYPFKGTALGNYCHQQGWVTQPLGEELVNLRSHIVLELPQITTDQLRGLYRTFPLYMNLPEWLDPIIRLAERGDAVGREVYDALYNIVQHKIDTERGVKR